MCKWEKVDLKVKEYQLISMEIIKKLVLKNKNNYKKLEKIEKFKNNMESIWS